MNTRVSRSPPACQMTPTLGSETAADPRAEGRDKKKEVKYMLVI